MFISLKIKNGFYNSSDINITFTEGLNVLIGPNGSGKSHTIDLLNYSLFGTQALRSSITDYKDNFSVTCEFKINNYIYKVERNAKSSKLSVFEDSKYNILVTGTTPVNSYIKDLLNYDYKIFSLTNYIKQNNLLNLTSCTPTALSELIQVISGISNSEKLEEYLKAKLSSLRSESKALESTKNNILLNNNITFNPNKEYDDLLKNGILKILQKRILDNTLKNNNNENFISNISTSLELLKGLEKELQILDKYSEYSIEDLTNSLIEIESFKNKINSLENTIRTIKKPKDVYTQEYLKEQENLIKLNSEYNSYLKVKAQFEENSVTCPSCNNVFSLHEECNPIPLVEAPEKPVLTSKDIQEQLRWSELESSYISSHKELEHLKTLLQSLPKGEELKESISLYNKYVKVKDQYLNLYNTLYTLIIKETDLDFDKNTLISFTNELILKIENDNKDLLINTTKDKELEDILVKYNADKITYDNIFNTVSTIENDINRNNEALKTVSLLKDVLLKCKKEIQSQILPVINTTSSNLLSVMTGGERSNISIDKTFNISVDNQSVDVLEGSGQVLTNICLRIALLNTFYKDSFLVFIGDEIDSPLHEDRFNFLEKALSNLVSLGYQLIIISHKEFNFGNIINLGSL